MDDIEPVTQGVKLTVIHDGFEPGSTMVQMVSGGWPDVISSLKTLPFRPRCGGSGPTGTRPPRPGLRPAVSCPAGVSPGW
jgi:hypothetical protein